MYEHLNTRTRQIVSALARGDSVELGGGSIEGFTGDEATVLKVLARHLSGNPFQVCRPEPTHHVGQFDCHNRSFQIELVMSFSMALRT